MKEVTSKTYLGVLAQRATVGASAIATGAMVFTFMAAHPPDASAQSCTDSNWCNTISSDCGQNASTCPCTFTDCAGGIGCYKCKAT